MEVGNVNSKHFVLALKVKSVLDHCEDDNGENHDESVNSSQENPFIVAPADKRQAGEDDTIDSEGNGSDDTQDPEEDEHQLSRIKDWISSCHLKTVEITDVLANFPDISMVLIEEIMDKLVLRGFMSKTGLDTYSVNQEKDSEYEFYVKEEIENQVPLNGNKAPPVSGEDYMYMKAFRVEHGIKEGTQKAENLYYEVSDGRSKKSTIYRLSNCATMLYEKPTGSTSSTGRSYNLPTYSQLQSQLKSTQEQLNEQRKLVESQQKAMEDAMKLIQNLQSKIDMISGFK